MGGLTLTINNKIDPYDGHLTFLGEILADLPVDPKIGKLLLLGHVFGVLEECLVIGKTLIPSSIYATVPLHVSSLFLFRCCSFFKVYFCTALL